MKFVLYTDKDGKKKLKRTEEDLRKEEDDRKKRYEELNEIKQKRSKWLKERRYRWCKEKGFKDWNDYSNRKRWEKGNGLPMNMNKSCSSYLGVYIAEGILPELFEKPTMMPYGNKGFDAICKNGFKIEVKSACIQVTREIYESWKFPVRRNRCADYFMFIAFDNRVDLNVRHIWLIKGNEFIIGRNEMNRKLNDYLNFSVSNVPESLNKFKSYELVDKLDMANDLCKKFKGESC